MNLLKSFSSVLMIVLLLRSSKTQECDESTLERLMDALSGSVQYVAEHKDEMNVDGIVSLTILVDKLKVLDSQMNMDNVPQDLTQKLYAIRDNAQDTNNRYWYILKDSDPFAFSVLGGMIKPGSWELHYPLQSLNRSLIKTPLTCNQITWSWNMSDYCLSQLLNYKVDQGSNDEVTQDCWSHMTPLGYKDYPLTHELIYIMFGETTGYFKTFNKTQRENVQFLKNYFCANVFRDASELADKDFPVSFRDLFMEQIGLCSLYGFTDFFKKDWIDATLSWRQPSGCYHSPKHHSCIDDKSQLFKSRRRKREDVRLNDGCSSHTTSMGIIAMITQISFCLEMIYGNDAKPR